MKMHRLDLENMFIAAVMHWLGARFQKTWQATSIFCPLQLITIFSFRKCLKITPLPTIKQFSLPKNCSTKTGERWRFPRQLKCKLFMHHLDLSKVTV